jgi:hypothetical protein
LLAHGRWFSSGTPASSTTKTGRHDIAEILLKVALKHKKSIKIMYFILHRNGYYVGKVAAVIFLIVDRIFLRISDLLKCYI